MIRIFHGNFQNSTAAYNFGKMLEKELLEMGVDEEIIHQPFTHAKGSGISFSPHLDDAIDEAIEEAIFKTFKRSDMWEEDEEERESKNSKED